MTEPADFEHDLATQVLIELYSEIPPPSKLVTGHFHSGGDYRVVRPDGVGSWYLLYTASGTGRYVIGQNTLTLRHGDVVLVSPGTPARLRDRRDVLGVLVGALPAAARVALLAGRCRRQCPDCPTCG